MHISGSPLHRKEITTRYVIESVIVIRRRAFITFCWMHSPARIAEILISSFFRGFLTLLVYSTPLIWRAKGSSVITCLRCHKKLLTYRAGDYRRSFGSPYKRRAIYKEREEAAKKAGNKDL